MQPEAAPGVMIWMVPTLAALFLYGIAQGLVKKYISDVPPARYCLYFFSAKVALYGGYWLFSGRPNPFSGIAIGAAQAPLDGRLAWTGLSAPQMVIAAGILGYVLEGIGWICYYESIVSGPITIVGTLSAAYAAPTVVFAYLFLGETLTTPQTVGVTLVIAGCAGLAYSPPDPDAKITSNRWIPLAFTALVFWGLWNTLVKYSYSIGLTPDPAKAPAWVATDVKMAIYNVCGAAMTLGLYGLVFGREGSKQPGEWKASVIPMAMMAGGDLGVIIANAQTGAQVGVITAISSAYPLVTLVFASIFLKESITKLQWGCLVAVLIGMYYAGQTPS